MKGLLITIFNTYSKIMQVTHFSKDGRINKLQNLVKYSQKKKIFGDKLFKIETSLRKLETYFTR